VKALVLLIAPLAMAQSVVLGTRSADGKVVFEAVDDVQINQSRRVRLAPEKSDADPRRLPRVDLAQAGVLRGEGGRVVSLSGPNAPRQVVLADNLAPRLTITAVRRRQPSNVAPETFFTALFGASPEESAREFVDKDWAFSGIDDQLAAMQGFVASFGGSPAVKEFRDSLQARISAALDAFEDGGAYAALVRDRRYSETARQMFPGDAAFVALDDRIAARVRFGVDRPKLLRSLAALGDWDTLLEKYKDFGPYEASFPGMQALHEEALEESARTHSLRARAFERRGEFGKAQAEATLALARDPLNREIRKLLSDETLLSAQAEAQSTASRRRNLPKGLPAETRFASALASADRAIADKDFRKAQESIQDAERENPGAPEVTLAHAKMAAAQNRDAEALALLDQYDRVVTGAADREKGADLRRQVIADLERTEDALRQQVAALLKDGQYSQLAAALKGAPADAQFLYASGVAAAVLKDKDRATTALREFLNRSDAIGVDPQWRARARQILAILKSERPLTKRSNAGLFYDPQSLAFLIPADAVSAAKVRLEYSWTGAQLDSIRASFDDASGAQLYRALVVAGEADSGALAASSGEPGNFFFEYHPNGALREVLTAKDSLPGFRVHVTRDDQGHAMLIDDDERPEIVLPDHPYVDTQVLAALEGSPVTAVAAGSSFFHPFLWDGIHWFTVRYDAHGLAESAEEWNADSTVRFTWEGLRLISVRAYHKASDTPYYQRTISYSGASIAGEDWTVNGRPGHIRYLYANGQLQQVRIENEGKEWVARPR
jgi:hypothetical protein